MCAFIGVFEKPTIVGYKTVSTPDPGKYCALTVAFENVGENAAVPVANLVIVDSPAGSANVGLVTSDQIWRWDSANDAWVKYYYRKVGSQPAVGWCAGGATTVTTDTIPCGDTVFFRRGTGGAKTTMTLAGGVKPFTAENSYHIEPGKYCFMGYPWPVDMPIATFTKYQGNPVGSANVGLVTSDQIWRWDSANDAWVKYYYRKVGSQPAVGWCAGGATTVTSDVIPAGEGFFFRRGTGGATDTITFTYTAE